MISLDEINELKNLYLLNCDWHTHTNFVHGESTTEAMVQSAINKDLKAIAITEHIRKVPTYDFEKYLDNLLSIREKYKDKIKIIIGVEAKVINEDGELDVEEKIVKNCDIVLGVFHSWINNQQLTKKEYITVVERFLKNPSFHIWGHPLSLLRHYKLNLNREDIYHIVKHINKSSKLIEFNFKHNEIVTDQCFYENIDFNKIVFGSDAHNFKDVLDLESINCIVNTLLIK
ncbi:PHP domain-containing protein [Clostridium tyrobutyricum]|uniref:PHP domain-containing protein n=1 Tax=Clostridium tyrobutyricum TaxID=1519 RepID=UPI00073D4AFB|nr:PHP domain-containing protein [Clostridium tyrobutyricum]